MESPQKSNNTGVVIAVLCLVIGVVLGAMVVNTKSAVPSQEGAAIKSPVVQTTTTTSPYTPAQLEAQSKLKTRLVFQNTPEEVATAFGLDMKTFIRKAPDAKVRAVFDQMFGGNPSSTPYYEECVGQLSYGNHSYEVGSNGSNGYYWTTANCDWGF